jgi:acylphosphatase
MLIIIVADRGNCKPAAFRKIEASMAKRLHIRVYGRVQGVYYRYTAQQRAAELGLTGWVRNLPDGSVELLCEGPKADLNALAEWCRTGPRGARVEHTDFSWEEPKGDFRDFAIRY